MIMENIDQLQTLCLWIESPKKGQNDSYRILSGIK